MNFRVELRLPLGKAAESKVPGAGKIGSLVCFALCVFLLGSAGASLALFGALAEKHEGVSREARDTAGEAPALP